MRQFSCEALAKGVSRDKLYQWYTDFSPEDVDIMRRRGDGSLLSRKVTREGNKVHLENENIIRGKSKKLNADVVLHPDNHTYDVSFEIVGMLQSNRHYTFEEIPGQGTKIRFDDSYRVLSAGMKILDALGLFKGMYRKGSERILKTYVAEAEEHLAEKKW